MGLKPRFEPRLSPLDWLRRGDPSIAWQAERDLAGAPASTWQPLRARVETEGWGRRLLDAQNRDGHWGRGAYRPKWTSTTYTLQLLWRLGLPRDNPAARRAVDLLLDEGANHDGGINFWRPFRSVSETCVTGMVLAQASYFGVDDPRRERLVEHLLGEQLADGGWNCRSYRGDTHSSFHTTINVLDGLRLYDGPRVAAVRAAEARAREFFLAHRLFRSHRTGNIVKPQMTRLHFPPRWRHDVLRTIDHFRTAGAGRDARLADTIDILRKRRAADGRWPLDPGYPGEVFFQLETAGGASRWNTLRGMRVLQWWGARSD